MSARYPMDLCTGATKFYAASRSDFRTKGRRGGLYNGGDWNRVHAAARLVRRWRTDEASSSRWVGMTSSMAGKPWSSLVHVANVSHAFTNVNPINMGETTLNFLLI